MGPEGYISESEDESEHDGNQTKGEYDETDVENDGTSPPRERVRYDGGDGQGHFMLGMTFVTAQEVRDAITKYAMLFRYKLKLNPNEPYRIVAKCKNEAGFPFMLKVSKDGKNLELAIKTLKAEHRCFRHYSLPSASVKFIASHFKSKIYHNPGFKVKDIQAEAEEILKINVSFQKCKRAKRMVIEELDGSYRVQFQQLEAYAAALKSSNPGTKGEIELCKESLKEHRRVFRRMFICFEAIKYGWKAGCRPLIGLDGCFLKGVCKGHVLSAVGLDGNDKMVPIAWAIVIKKIKTIGAGSLLG